MPVENPKREAGDRKEDITITEGEELETIEFHWGL